VGGRRRDLKSKISHHTGYDNNLITFSRSASTQIEGQTTVRREREKMKEKKADGGGKAVYKRAIAVRNSVIMKG